MSRNADLDRAIDQVAARLTAVPKNDAVLSERIISSLPDRPSRLRWWIPQFAALGIIAVATLTWIRKPDAPRDSVLPSAAFTVVAAFIGPATADAPGAAAAHAAAPLQVLEPLKPLGAGIDFERALPAIAAMPSLSLSEVSPSVIVEPSAIELAPIEITDITVTAEFTPRR